jgi:DNA-binding NtrC family response regulator
MAMLKKFTGGRKTSANWKPHRTARGVTEKDYISEEDLRSNFISRNSNPRDDHREPVRGSDQHLRRNFILRALEKCGWNVTGTSEYLGIPLSTLKYKMDKLDVRQLARRLRGT